MQELEKTIFLAFPTALEGKGRNMMKMKKGTPTYLLLRLRLSQ
jgi:hypothetical protein